MEYGIWNGWDMGVWAYGRMGYGMGYGIGMGVWDWDGDWVGLGLGYGRMGFGILPIPLVWAASIGTTASKKTLHILHLLYMSGCHRRK